MTARCYYWTEIKRHRSGDVLRTLSGNGFFVEKQTISNTLVEQDDFYNELLRSKAPARKLEAMFPGFDWN